jgi:Na+/melibiose symporter-like transporter
VIDKVTAGNCLSKLGYHDVVKYQPASRYWHFQLAEAGLFVALAAVLIGIAIVYTLRRDA